MKITVHKLITLILISMMLAIILSVDAKASASRTKLPSCKAIWSDPGIPQEENGHKLCQAQNVWQRIPQSPGRNSEVPLSKKKVLTPDAYARWKRLDGPVLSDDGRWVAYTLTSATGAPELVVRSIRDVTEFRVARGTVALSDPPEDLSAQYDWQTPAQISADSRHAVFTLGDTTLPRQTSLGIMSLPDGRVEIIANVGAFAMPSGSGRHLAYKQSRAGWPSRLVLQDLQTAAAVEITDVDEFVFDESGRYLAYTISSMRPEHNGAYVRRLSDGYVTPLLNGPGRYQSLTFDGAGEQLAFLSDRDEHGTGSPRYSLYYASSPLQAAMVVVKADVLRQGLEISPHARVAFTRIAHALMFGVSPAAQSKPTESCTQFDLWHWQERAPLPCGKANKVRPYLSVYHIGKRRWTQLANAAVPEVVLTDDGHIAIGIDQVAHKLENVWKYPPKADVYLIDVMSGTPTLLRRGLQPASPFSKPRRIGNAQPASSLSYPFVMVSPSGRYMLYFEQERWWSMDLESRQVADLTGQLLPDTRFDSEIETMRGFTLGVGGWTEGDRRVLLYSRQDIWEIDPAGSFVPRNLTRKVTHGSKLVLRLWEHVQQTLMYPNAGAYVGSGAQFDRPFIAGELLLSALDRDTMASGIWRIRLEGNAAPERLVMLDKRVTPLAKARRAEQYLLTLESYRDYPDLWTGARFDRLHRISDANPQGAEYLWGHSRLVEFTSVSGLALKGRLYTPEDFDPAKKYPMLVSFYAIQSSELHTHGVPQAEGAPLSGSSWPQAVSRGYLYFVPDIMPVAGSPGSSAVAAVVPAARSLIARGFVDPERICISGSSKGGYHVNYIITQSTLFRCAVSGAGPSNLLSVYGTAHTPAFHEAGSGGAFGSSPWERLPAYLENSPLSYANRVRTPLLIWHGEIDSVVPFSQSREFFNALRRNGQPVWLFAYRGEDHNPLRPENKLHFDDRMWEFFDYHLKGTPRPTWMGAAVS